ncbi:MAG: helix-turn-helix transcriptional regulator [Bacteroidota bacterium]|nr:helix-turn-helix transcriptional regulator [Bacteroidota bacterium]
MTTQQNITLTPRQEQIAGLVACGKAKKEIADLLHISVDTVANIVKEIYVRTGLGKMNELAVWWISRRFRLSIDFSNLEREIVSGVCLGIVLFSIVFVNPDITRRGSRMVRRTDVELVNEEAA